MNPIPTLTCSVLLFIALPLGHARLGETREECIARYGANPTQIGSDALGFQHGTFEIHVHFADGKADYIHYERDTRFSKAQIDELLARNAPGKKWKITGYQESDPKLPGSLVSEDGELVASVSLFSGQPAMSLSIRSKAPENRKKQESTPVSQEQQMKEIEGL